MTRRTPVASEAGAPATPAQARRSRPKLPALRLSLQFADARHRALLARSDVARWVRAALAVPAEITVRIVDLAEGRALNREYRGQDHATNVLTFPYATAPLLSADLVLCAPVVEREASEQGLSLIAHYAHLLVHGTLHAQGYDHEREVDAERMEARESEILTGLGLADPYAR
jgi:probable rRNA maturation factor